MISNNVEKSYYHQMAFMDCSCILLGIQSGQLAWNASSSLSYVSRVRLSAYAAIGVGFSAWIAQYIAIIMNTQDYDAFSRYSKAIFAVTSSSFSALRAWQRYSTTSGLCWGSEYLERYSDIFTLNIDDYHKGGKTDIKIPIFSSIFWLYSFMDKDFESLNSAIDRFIPKGFSYIAASLTCCFIFYSLLSDYMSLDSECKPVCKKTNVEIAERSIFAFVSDGIKGLITFDNRIPLLSGIYYTAIDAIFNLPQVPYNSYRFKRCIMKPAWNLCKNFESSEREMDK